MLLISSHNLHNFISAFGFMRMVYRQEYLVDFLKMIRGFETCSLQGQAPVTIRHLRVKGTKLEFPMSLLKAHLSIDEKLRTSLLCDLLERKISFQTYKLEISEASKRKTQPSQVHLTTSTPIKSKSKEVSKEVSLSLIEPRRENESACSIETDDISSRSLDQTDAVVEKRKIGEVEHKHENSAAKRPKLVGMHSFSFSSEYLMTKHSVVIVAEVKEESDEYDVGGQAMRALWENYKEARENKVIGLFYR